MILKEFDKGSAHIVVFENRAQMGTAAGKEIACRIRELQKQKQEVNIMFAAAPSQNEVLGQLLSERGIDWTAVNALHMDEYIGISSNHPAGFANFLKSKIFSKLPFKKIFCMDSTASDPGMEAVRYADILKSHPLDICILGIGENGHVAFNDPGVADFEDTKLVKIVEIDERCRQQQVNDGCFDSIVQVPPRALTVTIPGLISADYMYCCVPGAAKAEAVHDLINKGISLACPASILTQKPNTNIYLDADSAKWIL